QNLNYKIYDLGDIDVIRTYEKKDPNDGDLRNLKEAVEANEKLKNVVSGEIAKGHFPIELGGDHSIAIGTISGVLKHYQNRGLIWYDAHGVINTAETSPSGNIYGMHSVASLGYGYELLSQIFENNADIMLNNYVFI